MRGRAIGVVYLFGAIGGVIFTMLAALIIESHGVAAAWISLGVVCLAVALLPQPATDCRNGPKHLGLRPDGDVLPESNGPAALPAPVQLAADDSWTMRESSPHACILDPGADGVCHPFLSTPESTCTSLRTCGTRAFRSPTPAAVVTASWIVSAMGSVGWGWLIERVSAPPHVFSDAGHAERRRAAAFSS